MLALYVGGEVGGGVGLFEMPNVDVGGGPAYEDLQNGGYEISGGSSYGGGGGSFWGGLLGGLFRINIPALFGISIPSPIRNWHYDSSGLAVPDGPNDSLADCSPDGNCQTLIWFKGEWESQCQVDPDWCNAADVLGTASQIASPKNIFTIYAASVATGVGGYVAYDIAQMESGALFGTRFGGNTPLLNNNDVLRIGWSYIRSSNEYVFRIGGDMVPDWINGGHVNLWPPRWWFGPPNP